MIRQRLSTVDNAWLRMEDPTSLMMVTGVMIFGAPLNWEQLLTTLEEKLLCFDRFRQRVVQPVVGLAHWEPDSDFNIDHHVLRTTLPAPAGLTELQDLVSQLASMPLDFRRPLWQIHVIDNYNGGSALICRIHHCIGDGLALVHVLLSLTDTDPAAPARDPRSQSPEPVHRRATRRIARHARTGLRTARKLSGSALHGLQDIIADPSRVRDIAKAGTDSAKAAATLLLRWPDPDTVLRGTMGVSKRAAWTAPISLQDVKAIGEALDGTVNDVLLTAMSGALRRYLQQRGEPVDGLGFRAAIPVNLRKPGTEEELGNRFGIVFLSLPVGIADPEERLRELKQRMDGIKDSREAPVSFAILHAMGLIPKAAEDVVVEILSSKATVVVTNVIGPSEQIYLTGAPLESLMFWVPLSGHVGLGISILSYAGQVWAGVFSDERLVPDPDAIVGEFHAEFDLLLEQARHKQPPPTFQQLAGMLDAASEVLDGLRDQKHQGSGPAKGARPA